LNVAGREAQGTLAQSDYEKVRDDLAAQIKAIPDDKGHPLNTQVFKPQAIYQQVNHIAPDLMVYFGDLHWRTVGSIGLGQHFTLENDTGPDDANHAPNGMFILRHPHKTGSGCVKGSQLMDIAPTILNLMQIPIPKTMQGQVIGV
jgi:predicted AlkP superfamily phosphohydrolase/phosphomutase